MATAIVTGSCGLVGSSVAELLIENGLDVVGIDNDTRGAIFGPAGSVLGTRAYLVEKYEAHYVHKDLDIRDEPGIGRVFLDYSGDVKLVVHAAGQPSHDWSAQAPVIDFDINARGTLILLEATRNYCVTAPFIFLSTNKVYGDWVNRIGMVKEAATRYIWPMGRHIPAAGWKGVNERAPIDRSLHSPFGVSKLAADLMVQEYSRYFGIPSVCFRCGCITGGAHRGVRLHGFLAYLATCIKEGLPYTVYGYKGKQVRDNIHAEDLARAIIEFYEHPKLSAIYNMGGGYDNSCSILEAIDAMEGLGGRKLDCTMSREARRGDHKWWITDVSSFADDYPNWKITVDLWDIYEELMEV